MRPAKTDLSKEFAAFAGREVQATEHKHNVTIAGRDFPYTEVRFAENDPALAELNASAKAAGLHVRLWLPNSMGTMDYQRNRLNVNIEKARDGKYRLGSSFTIG